MSSESPEPGPSAGVKRSRKGDGLFVNSADSSAGEEEEAKTSGTLAKDRAVMNGSAPERDSIGEEGGVEEGGISLEHGTAQSEDDVHGKNITEDDLTGGDTTDVQRAVSSLKSLAASWQRGYSDNQTLREFVTAVTNFVETFSSSDPLETREAIIRICNPMVCNPQTNDYELPTLPSAQLQYFIAAAAFSRENPYDYAVIVKECKIVKRRLEKASETLDELGVVNATAPLIEKLEVLEAKVRAKMAEIGMPEEESEQGDSNIDQDQDGSSFDSQAEGEDREQVAAPHEEG